MKRLRAKLAARRQRRSIVEHRGDDGNPMKIHKRKS